MATSCSTVNKIYIIFVNGTATGKTMLTPTNPNYVGFDSKGHFIQLSYHQIAIYNQNKNITRKNFAIF